MTKKLVVSASLLAKSQVAAYTRKDGTMVQSHDNGRQAAAPKPAAKAKPAAADYGDHPNVVGKAHKFEYGDDAKSAKSMHFAGKQYFASGKTGNSFHDNTPLRHFTEMTESGDDDGEHVWMDDSGRVHADAKSDVPRLRAAHEAHAAKSAPKPKRQLKVKASLAPAHTPDPHHSDLEEGDELLDEKGQKHEYSATHRGIGRMQVEMRSGHKVPTSSDGKLTGWKKTGRNNVTGAGHEPHPAAAKTGSAAPEKR